MIKVSSKTLMLIGEDGRRRALDSERLLRDLEACFASAGVHEPWLSAHIVAVLVEEREDDSDSSDAAVPEAEFYALVRRLLADTGYPDVAAEFTRRRGPKPPRRAPPPLLPWSERRVLAVLAKSATLGEACAGGLGQAVVAKLEGLGFPEVSDGLIESVAEHCLVALARAQRTAPAGESAWLRPSGFWEPFFAGDTAAMLTSGVLTIHPVSHLFPVVRITLNLPLLAEQCHPGGSGPLPEPVFVPALDAACARAVAAIPVVYQTVLERLPSQSSHPTHVQVAGLQALMRSAFGKMKRGQRGEVEAGIREHLVAAFRAAPFRIVFSILP